MDSVQEQEAKKQKLEQEQVEDVVEEEEEEEGDEYTEQDLKLGHELIAAVIANDLVKFIFKKGSNRPKTNQMYRKKLNCF